MQLSRNIPKHLTELHVYCVTTSRIAKLHARFLNDPTPTDVITFDHGEIFICPAVAERQRKEMHLSLYQEILTYAIHALLHLCGWSDHEKNEFENMKKKQESILQDTSKNNLGDF